MAITNTQRTFPTISLSYHVTVICWSLYICSMYTLSISCSMYTLSISCSRHTFFRVSEYISTTVRINTQGLDVIKPSSNLKLRLSLLIGWGKSTSQTQRIISLEFEIWVMFYNLRPSLPWHMQINLVYLLHYTSFTHQTF